MSTSKRSKEVAATKAYYEKNAQLWTSLKTNSFHHEIEFRKFASLLPQKAHVIDIGCASGIHVPLFLGIGRHLKYTGVDIAKSFLKIAQKRYPQLSFTEGDISHKESLPKKRFDGFLAVAVLMHVPLDEWDTAFKNLESLLKPHAYGYLSLPVEHPSGDKASTDSRHFTLLDETAQIEYIKRRGWKILKRTTKHGSATNDAWRGYIVQVP